MKTIISLCGMAAVLGLAACSGPIEEEMGPQIFDTPSIAMTGVAHEEVMAAVDAAVETAETFGFRYDASRAADGFVDVHALWKGSPVTMTMRFYRRSGRLFIATALDQPGDVFLDGGGAKLEQLFYTDLGLRTTERGLALHASPPTEAVAMLND